MAAAHVHDKRSFFTPRKSEIRACPAQFRVSGMHPMRESRS
jgi:hypothetical protein